MTGRRYFVHVYKTIRIKVAVDAEDHRAAMQAADAVVFGDRHAVRLDSLHMTVIDTEYLADEAAFRAHVDAVAVHLTQRAALGRREAKNADPEALGHVAGRDNLCRRRRLLLDRLARQVQVRPRV